jgi:hypothetical protein
MSFFHLHPSPSPAAASAWALYQQLDRSQWLTPADIERNQPAALDALLAHCARHIPYHRKLLPEVGIPSAARTAAQAAPKNADQRPKVEVGMAGRETGTQLVSCRFA